jgi:hypothetical protein
MVLKVMGAAGYYTPSQFLLPIGSSNSSRGGKFGFSVAIDGDTLVVGACEQDASVVYLGTKLRENTEKAGLVYVYSRNERNNNDFLFWEYLKPSNVRYNDRFGYSVAVQNDVIVASSIEDFSGELVPSAAIIQVLTRSDHKRGITVSGTFSLYYTSTNRNSSYRRVSTRRIPHDASPYEMKIAIEEDFKLGTVLVSRSNPTIYDRSYSWQITFVGATYPISLFDADWSDLFGSNATVEVSFINPTPPRLRGKAHVFHNVDSTVGYVEQFFMTPLDYQPNDRCGWQVGISGL